MTPISTSTGLPPVTVAPIVGGVEPGKTVYFVELPEITAKILALTKEMFQSEVELQRKFDPAGGDEPNIIFTVDTNLNVEALLAKHDEWHQMVRELSPGWNTYTLAAYVANET